MLASTDNVIRRLKEHNQEKNKYTKGRKPWKLVYQECYKTKNEALEREKFLKSGQGRKLLDDIINNKTK